MGLPEPPVVHFIFLIQTVKIFTPCKQTHVSKKERVKVCYEGISCAHIHQLHWFRETRKKGADIKHTQIRYDNNRMAGHTNDQA